MAFCLLEENLKPFAIIIPGIYIQFWIVTIISYRTNKTRPSQNEELLLNEHAEMVSTVAYLPAVSLKSKCFNVFKSALKIWQIVSVAGILALDILHFVTHVKNHQELSAWSHYNCMVEIISSSSNLKTFLANVSWMFAMEKDGPIRADADILSWVFFYMMIINLIMGIPIFLTHLFPALFCYCWFWIPLVVLMFKSVHLLERNQFLQKHERVFSRLFGVHLDNADDDDLSNIMKSPLILITITICMFTIPLLSMCYLYSGNWEYVDSFVEVLTERSILNYISNVCNTFSSMFRFLSTIL